MKLIAGLGNPGKNYQYTRHNIGFEIIDQLAKAWSIPVKAGQLKSKTGFGRVGPERVILAKPATFMNLSGEAIQLLVNYYRLDIKDILIVCDDVNLKPGRIRIRPQGSHGGHNGLLSIISTLKTKEFVRLRIGVDKPEPQMDLSDYVLSVPDKAQSLLLAEGLELGIEVIQAWLTESMTHCMTKYNQKITS